METLSMVTGHQLATDSGLTEGTVGHVSVLAWVPGCLACSFGLFIFFNVRKIIQRYMHKRVNVIGLAATRSRCNRCLLTNDEPM